MNNQRESDEPEKRPLTERGMASELPTLDGPSFQERLIANRYALLSRLGKGGMGEVWRAYDQKLRVDVALKSLRMDLKNVVDRVEALRNEVRIAREVISPNVCRIFDLVVEEDRELISMEYIDGTTLMEMILHEGSLELKQARDIAAQFLAGLEAIHRTGLVHRDLKPENIMITRSGRVVVMDFGIAKHAAQTGGTVAGTFPYMAPEHISGDPVDARSDVFSAGVVLAEMIHPQGILGQETRQDIWNAVRDNPMRLADGPWKPVIVRAVAVHPNDRFSSAAALSRALEEATQRVETTEEQSPYPGLASFTSDDAEYFFGRELEVENAIKKLQQLHLMALVGPSGAGKTSFLRAGLIPALLPGWNHIFCAPGDSPVLNLAQALVPELSSDAEAMQKILRFEDPKIASYLFHHWRHKHTEVVLIIDRFEELFTLNAPDVQTRFVQLVADAALESDVRVLLSMRDDFLLRCHDFPPLAPLFSELTPLGPMNGSALRRAMVQPALKAGYRYEDEKLLDEILVDVERERGALPLMAFAAARLWEKRNRQTGELTRESYRQIGGVAGALAQHAEETMERIGPERLPIVREIFRNLITSENTRAARDTEDLLSVFPQKQIADEVLRALIDARLLTSFEAVSLEGEKPRRRVEIIHESLLSAWPRLVRWQTQDADSAQLRDQLRQAAQLWERRSRSDDLLWTGTAFLEFQAWRQRYPGNLTPTEEAFAEAMLHRANQKRRQRRIFITTMFVLLLGVVGIISGFWRKATIARDQAVSETHRAEASKMLALGRADPNADPSTKLAYALASLEFQETPEGSRFAGQALSEGPPARVMQSIVSSAELSPDGKWLVAADMGGGVQLFSQNGAKPRIVNETFRPGNFVQWKSQFSPDSRFLLWTVRKDLNTVKVWSIAEKKVIRAFKFEGLTICFVRGGRAFFVTDTSRNMDPPFTWGQCTVRTWNFDQEEPIVIGSVNLGKVWWKTVDIDWGGRWIAYDKTHNVYVRSLKPDGFGVEKLVGSHPARVDFIRFRPDADEVAATDASGEIRLWSLLPSKKNPIRVFSGNEGGRSLWFDPKGFFLFSTGNGMLLRWDLRTPDAEPNGLRTLEPIRDLTFDREERWMAIAGGSSVAFYPLTHKYPYLFRPTTKNQGSSNVRFTPDGKFFVNCFTGDGLLITSMPEEKQYSRRLLWNSRLTNAGEVDIDRSGKFVLGNVGGEGIHLVSIADGKDRLLEGKLSDGGYDKISISPDAKFAAATGDFGIEVWEIQTDDSRVLEKSKGISFSSLKFTPDGTLLSGDNKGNLYQWNLKDDSAKILRVGQGWISCIAVSQDGRLIATVVWSSENQEESATSRIVIRDLKTNKSSFIDSHGGRVLTVAFDPGATRIITGDREGIIRVGSISSETPHLLLGNDRGVDIDIHPNGKWIATNGNPIRLWQMPEGAPIESLPYAEFLNRLRDLTNVRVVVDKNSPTGFRTSYAQFVGWKTAPDW